MSNQPNPTTVGRIEFGPNHIPGINSDRWTPNLDTLANQVACGVLAKLIATMGPHVTLADALNALETPAPECVPSGVRTVEQLRLF